VKVTVQIAEQAAEFLIRLQAVFGALPLLERLLRRFLVLPEVGVAYLLFKAGEGLPVAGDVKDSSARARCASSVLRNDVPNLPESWPEPMLEIRNSILES
jgi:hypothetical protein